jgi:hypothetical protein
LGLLSDPQIKKLPPSKLPPIDKMLEGCLPTDPLLLAEPFFWLQRLYLRQLFPALFTAARKNLASSGSPCAGKKAVLVTSFSFGRLVCSFHEARIIVKFVCNIQRFVSMALRFFLPLPLLFSLKKKLFLLVDKKFFCCRMPLVLLPVRFLLPERTFILVCFLLWKTCLQAIYYF